MEDKLKILRREIKERLNELEKCKSTKLNKMLIFENTKIYVRIQQLGLELIDERHKI